MANSPAAAAICKPVTSTAVVLTRVSHQQCTPHTCWPLVAAGIEEGLAVWCPCLGSCWWLGRLSFLVAGMRSGPGHGRLAKQQVC